MMKNEIDMYVCLFPAGSTPKHPNPVRQTPWNSFLTAGQSEIKVLANSVSGGTLFPMETSDLTRLPHGGWS